MEDVTLEIYKTSACTPENLLLTSGKFTINGTNNTVDLASVFHQTKVYFDDSNLNYISFRLISSYSDAQLAYYGVRVFDTKNSTKKTASNRSFEVDGNLSYQFQNNTANINESGVPKHHSIDYSINATLHGLPFQLNGLWTDYKDPYYDYDLSNFTAYFDVNKWKEAQRNKVRDEVTAEANHIYGQMDDYNGIIKKYEHYSKVWSQKNVVEDFNSLGNSLDFLDSLGLLSEESLKKYIEEKRKNLEILTLNKDTSRVLRDSILIMVNEGNEEIEELEEHKANYQKYLWYQRVKSVKDSCEQVVERANQIKNLVQEYNSEILDNPSNLNQRLKKSNRLKGHERYLNYLSEAKYGLLSINYSDHVLQGSRNTGMAVGVADKFWGIHVFRSTLTGRQDNAFSEKIEVEQNSLMGGKVELMIGNQWKQKFFIISSLSNNLDTRDYPKSLLGYGLSYNTNKRELDINAVWSRKDKSNNTESGTSVKDRLSNLALDLLYSRFNESKTIEWISEVELIGPQYFDFNNPFQFRNNILLKSKLKWKVNNSLRSSVNTFFQKANIFEESSAMDFRTMWGLNINYTSAKLPSINYSMQLGFTSLESDQILNQLHSLGFFYSYNLREKRSSTMLNISISKNKTDVDSLASSNLSINVNQHFQMNTVIGANFNISMTSSTLLDEKFRNIVFDLGVPLNYNAFQFNGGVKRVFLDDLIRWGWFCRARYQINNSLELEVNLDSAIRSGHANELGDLIEEYYSMYNISANYKF